MGDGVRQRGLRGCSDDRARDELGRAEDSHELAAYMLAALEVSI